MQGLVNRRGTVKCSVLEPVHPQSLTRPVTSNSPRKKIVRCHSIGHALNFASNRHAIIASCTLK